GVNRLFIRAKKIGINNLTRKLVKQFLAKQDVYTLYRPARRRFLRNFTMSTESIINGKQT
ncbi:hypothetical protein NL533_32675, partial [Klebsiella pneumoniae]|nr:hypothetical protein [Klebsiella pneumoniae]